jgi:hypothetical protein
MFTNNGFNPRPEVRVSFNREWNEFRVTHGGVTHHTDDAADAYDTAQFISRREGRKLVISSSAKSRIAKVSNL